jgi:hypothetical protein
MESAHSALNGGMRSIRDSEEEEEAKTKRTNKQMISNLKTLSVQWDGVTRLIQHNGRLANPRDPFAKAIKAISGQRKKSEDDFEKMSRLEFEGSLYWDKKFGVVVPCDNITAAIIEGARKFRLGKDAEAAI